MKSNVKEILVEHMNTLRDYRTDKISPRDIFISFVIPLVVSVLAVPILGVTYHNQEGYVIISLSIFVSVLFNLMVFVSTKNIGGSQLEKEQKNEIHSNISYNILVAIFSAAILFLIVLVKSVAPEIVLCSLRLLTLYLLMNFFMTMLLILKRINKVAKRKLND